MNLRSLQARRATTERTTATVGSTPAVALLFYWAKMESNMPDANGVLSDEEKDRARKWVESHAEGNFTCVLCKTKTWALADHIVALPVANAAGYAAPTLVTIPQFHLYCTNCGRGEFFNALYTGVIKPDPDSQENAKGGPSTAASEVREVGNGR